MIHFIFFFGINQVRRRSGEGGTMCFGLSIRRYKSGMEDVVDLPCGRKVESVYQGR